MDRADDAEVAPVEGGNGPRAEPLGSANHRGVDGAQRQIAVDRDELGDPQQVARFDWLENQLTGREVFEQADLSLVPSTPREQVRDLCQAQRGNEEGTRMLVEELNAGAVVSVVCVEIGEERPRVD